MVQDLKDDKNADPGFAEENLVGIGPTCFDDLPADG